MMHPTVKLTLALLLLFAAGCGHGGDVVTVTTLNDTGDAGLNAAERKKLAQIREMSTKKQLDETISNVIESTPHYSVSEYFRKYPAKAKSRGSDYRVGAYDVLNITVYEEADLSREALRVSGDGVISFPLISRVKVDALTTTEIEKLIARKLSGGQYLLDAHVSVMVKEYNSKHFMVLGEVNQPGSYTLQAKERIIDGISRAGGIRRSGENSQQATGAGKKLMVIRTEQPGSPQEQRIVITIDLPGLLKLGSQNANLFIVDEDVLYIPPAEHFYIIGQVRKTGAYPLIEEETTLVEAITKAGGFTPVAARNRTRILRIEGGKEQIIEVKVDAITGAGKKIQDVVILPDDVIYVPESFF
jgi:polysaccharide export outer membrane protein